MTNEELFCACVKGDPQAQSFLYKKYHKNLFSICKKYFNNEHDSMDCLQDGFIHIFRKLKTVDINNVLILGSWLRVVMRNYCLDVVRKKKRELYFDNIEYFTSEITSEDEFEPLVSHNTLLELIENLSPQFKNVFIMYALDDMQHKDIAEKLGISVNTSKTNYHRAKKSLKKSLYRLKLI